MFKKTVTCLLVILFGINVVATAAGTVDDLCVSQVCCCCIVTPNAFHGPTSADDSAGHGCCSSSTNSPCNLNKKRMPDTQAFIVSNAMEGLWQTDGFMTSVIGDPSLLQSFKEDIETTLFWITTDPIPIYLQNLTLIC